MTPAVQHVWEVLQLHVGRDAGVSCAKLAAQAQASERDVREAVTELRNGGVAVCGYPRSGYYIARTAEELDETCRFLRGRALHSLQLEARLRKLPMQELVGQISLNLKDGEGR